MKRVPIPIVYIKKSVNCTELCLFQAYTACIRFSALSARAVKDFIEKVKNTGPSCCLLGTSEKYVIEWKIYRTCDRKFNLN